MKSAFVGSSRCTSFLMSFAKTKGLSGFGYRPL